MYDLSVERKGSSLERTGKKALSVSDPVRKQMPVIDVMKPVQRMKDRTKNDYNKCRKKLAEKMKVEDKSHPVHGRNFDPSKKRWKPEDIIDDLLKPLERQNVNTQSYRQLGEKAIQCKKTNGLEEEGAAL